MLDIIFQAAALIACGVAWRWLKPQGLEADTLRLSLTGLVYNLLLPALVMVVLWRAPLNMDAVRVAVSAAFGVLFGLGAARLWYAWRKPSHPVLGAMLLAAAFPNATYMGLPVLEATLGTWARSTAIQYDLFACTPLLLSLGVVLSAHYGGVKEARRPFVALLKVPPFWAAVAGLLLNSAAVPLPQLLEQLLERLAAGVVPLMLFALGLGLKWGAGAWRGLPVVSPIIVIQLLLTPLAVWAMGGTLGLTGEVLTAVVLEAAMPSMVLGIVLCDRYQLDTSLYAIAVTLTTLLSMLTLPFWFGLLA